MHPAQIVINETLILEIYILFSLSFVLHYKNQKRMITGRDMIYLVIILIVFFEMITTDTESSCK